MFPNRRHIHLTGGTTFPENIFKTFYSILIITRLLCIFLFFCLIFNGWDDKRVKAYSVNNLEIKWETFSLGNIIYGNTTWKHRYKAESFDLNLETSLRHQVYLEIYRSISISNKPIFSSSQCSFQCHLDCLSKLFCQIAFVFPTYLSCNLHEYSISYRLYDILLW